MEMLVTRVETTTRTELTNLYSLVVKRQILLNFLLGGRSFSSLDPATRRTISFSGMSSMSFMARRSAAALLGAVTRSRVLGFILHTCLMLSTRVTVLPVPGGPKRM